MSYYFKSTNINQIIEPGSINVGGNDFIGFPTSDSTDYQFLRPLPIGFKRNGADISNLCTATFIEYNSTFRFGVFGSSNSTNLTAPANANYISVICVGPGGGGGGGSTGLGSKNKGSPGGGGGDGAYSAIGKYPININTRTNINITVGIGGLGGEGGNDDNNGGSGNNGKNGLLGTSSKVILDSNILLCRSDSGNVGVGGGGGNANTDDNNPGGKGNTNEGFIIATGGDFRTVYDDTSNHPYISRGAGGSGSSGSNDDAPNASPGEDGYVRIIFLYD